MGSEVQVALVGATGAVGQEILSVLDKAPWRPNRVVPFARPSTKTPFVEYGEEQLAVEDLNFANLADFNLVFVATPAAAASEIVENVVRQGVPVVDVSGVSSLQGDVPLVIPWVNPEAFERVGARGVVSVPGAAASIVASVAGPMVRANLLSSFSGTVLVPASGWGRDGLDELSGQVVALCSGTRRYLRGLAFDVMGEVGQRLDSGSTVAELMAETQVEASTRQVCWFDWVSRGFRFLGYSGGAAIGDSRG